MERHVPHAVHARGLTYRHHSRVRGVVHALREVTLSVAPGGFVAVVGRSGAGKSTLLHILARLLAPESGTVSYPAFDAQPRIGYLFQADAAFPWRTVANNLTYALDIRGVRRHERQVRAEELCLLVNLNPARHLTKYPAELSGGELRRVGLGMALADHPDILLLDEPTSAVDWITRRQLQHTLQDVMTKSSAATIIVTHDIEEAVWLSDRVVVLRDGSITDRVRVDLARPRRDAMRTSDHFRLLEDRVMSALGDTASDESELAQ